MQGSHDPATMLQEIEARIGPLPERHRRAYLTVDRARFVRECDRAYAWRDWPLPLDTPHGRAVPPVATLIAEYGDYRAALFSAAFSNIAATISAPTIYAVAYGMLALSEGDKLLELGTGTGYGAALAAEIVGPTGRVTSVEVDPTLVRAARERTQLDHVTFLHDDGLLRPDQVAEHNRVCLTFAVERLPQPLLDALQEGSVLVAPVGQSMPSWPPPTAAAPAGAGDLDISQRVQQIRDAGFGQTMMRYRRVAGELQSESLAPVMFVRARKRIDAS